MLRSVFYDVLGHWASGSCATSPRYVRTRKKAAYNPWGVYAEVAMMSFRSLRKFPTTKTISLKRSFPIWKRNRNPRNGGMGESSAPRPGIYFSRPLGYQGHILPVDVRELHAKLSDGKADLVRSGRNASCTLGSTRLMERSQFPRLAVEHSKRCALFGNQEGIAPYAARYVLTTWVKCARYEKN